MVSKNSCYPLLLVLAVMGGCTHYTEKLDTNLQSWVGKHPDELISQWGAPRTHMSWKKAPRSYPLKRTKSIRAPMAITIGERMSIRRRKAVK